MSQLETYIGDRRAEQSLFLIKKKKRLANLIGKELLCKWNCWIKCTTELFLEVPENSPAYDQIRAELEVSRLTFM